MTMDWMRRVSLNKARLKREAVVEKETRSVEAALPAEAARPPEGAVPAKSATGPEPASAPQDAEPTWTVKQYAALCVELSLGESVEVLRRFHLTEAAAERLHAHFRGGLEQSAELRQQWNEARRVYLEWKRSSSG